MNTMIYRAPCFQLVKVQEAFLILVLFLASGFQATATHAQQIQAPTELQSARPDADRRPSSSFNFTPHFVENRGQMGARVGFQLLGADRTFYFTDQGVTIVLPPSRGSQSGNRWTVKLDFVDPRPGSSPEGHNPARAAFSYLKGPRANWKTGVKSFHEVVYRDLWPGIDMTFSAAAESLKYTFTLQPGTDPGRIQLAWSGATAYDLTRSGDLLMSTPAGPLTDSAPISFQADNSGQEIQVPTKFVLGGPSKEYGAGITVGFDLDPYDRTRSLVIDPGVLIYSGFLGGDGADYSGRIAVDSAGNAYIAGSTTSTEATFPAVVGPDLSANGGGFDAFVAKIDPTGKELIYCSFLGGDHLDLATDIAVDLAGNAYVVGYTISDEGTFPVLLGPDLTKNGQFSIDGFVTKIDPTGSQLLYSGFIGGVSDDSVNAIAVDAHGYAYLGGQTSSSSGFPLVSGPDMSFNGKSDAFIAKVTPGGTSLLYSGYLGGNSDDEVTTIAVDSLGAAYIGGITSSREDSFPVVGGPDLSSDGEYSGFVAKISAGGTRILYCGFIDGDEQTVITGNAVDKSGSHFVSGSTTSNESTFPVVRGPDLTHNGGYDAFVAKVNPAGSSLDFCGYIGGSAADSAVDLTLDFQGNLYVVGGTDSNDSSFPAFGGLDSSHNGDQDAFLTKVDAAATALEYSGFLGGRFSEAALGVTTDTTGAVYLVGEIFDNGIGMDHDFPVLIGPDLEFNGGIDTFITKISNGCFEDGFGTDELDGGWQMANVGDADQGSFSLSGSQLFLSGDGVSLFRPSTDSFVLFHRNRRSGDFRAEVDIAAFPSNSGGELRRAGLIARASNAPDAPMVQVSVSPNLSSSGKVATLQFRYRAEIGGPGDGLLGSRYEYNFQLPVRLAVERQAEEFRVYYSTDGGKSWKKPSGGSQGSVWLSSFGPTALVGPFVVSYDSNRTLTAAFDNFKICGSSSVR